jgi:hypothetical protein
VRSVLTVEHANLAPTATLDASNRSDPIDFVFAPESRCDAVDFRHPPLHLLLSQLKRIHALRTVCQRPFALTQPLEIDPAAHEI